MKLKHSPHPWGSTPFAASVGSPVGCSGMVAEASADDYPGLAWSKAINSLRSKAIGNTVRYLFRPNEILAGRVGAGGILFLGCAPMSNSADRWLCKAWAGVLLWRYWFSMGPVPHLAIHVNGSLQK